MAQSAATSTEGQLQAISVNDLLAKQEQVRLIGTLEPVPSDPDLIKFTPALPGNNCLCQFAFVIPKSVIAEVIPTGETHFCCGKHLEFVEIRLAEDGQISARAVVEQVVKNANSRGGANGSQARYSSPQSFAKQSSAGTCICDHFIKRYCSGGQLYEDYWCYDETGAFCGTTTVPLGVSCSDATVTPGTNSGFRSLRETGYRGPATAGPIAPFAAQPFGAQPFARTTSQWSGYITLTADNGSTITFYVGCFGDGPYSINKSQIVYIDQRGICGNYGAYYIVFNY